MSLFGKWISYAVVLVGALTLQACPSNNNLLQNKDSINVSDKAKVLRSYYNLVVERPSTENKLNFFEEFPGTFTLFLNLYGYSENGDLHVLYEESQSHISLFCELRNIVDKRKYYKKVINLSLNGYWQADAVNYFQHCIIEIIKDDFNPIISTLAHYTDQEIQSFWRFLFEGPHASSNIPIDINKIKEVDARIGRLAEKAIVEIKNANDRH